MPPVRVVTRPHTFCGRATSCALARGRACAKRATHVHARWVLVCVRTCACVRPRARASVRQCVRASVRRAMK
eukprot:15469361-Alexandrium_andersonii.AAC.1